MDYKVYVLSTDKIMKIFYLKKQGKKYLTQLIYEHYQKFLIKPDISVEVDVNDPELYHMYIEATLAAKELIEKMDADSTAFLFVNLVEELYLNDIITEDDDTSETFNAQK